MAIVQTSVQQYPRIWHFLGRSVVRAWASWMLIIVIILTATPPTALAHSKVEVGAHRIVVGWASEPPLVGLRNAITVEISRDQVPLQDSKTSLILELRYAGRSRRSPLTPTATPGLYTVDLIPTVRGQYTVHVSGQIDGVAIDQALEPEEVLPATHLQFPETQPAGHELQSTVATLEAKLQSLHTWATADVGCGALGCIMAVASLLMARRDKAAVR